MSNIHPLKLYLAENGIMIQWFANKMKRDRSYLSKIINYHVIPSEAVASHIELLTNGIVKADSLISRKTNDKRNKKNKKANQKNRNA